MTVYKYGCPHWADLDDTGIEQLRLGNQLWNKLVEIHKKAEETTAAIWGTHPEVAAAQEKVEQASKACEDLASLMLKNRQHDRSTKPRVEDKKNLTDARRARKDTKVLLKAAKDAAMPDMRPKFADAKKEKGDAIKETYPDFIARGLHYTTHTDIRRHFLVAIDRINKQRNEGRAAELRFRRFDATGTLTVQIMWAAGKPLCGPELLSMETPYPAAWLDGDQRYRTLRLRLSGGRLITLPVIVHREMDARAEVKEIKVTRRRIAGQHRLTVAIVCRIPAPPAKTQGEALDIDFGWASGGRDVGLRVARVASASGTLPDPPAEVAGMVTAGDWYEIWLPGQWRDIAGRPDAIRADRDDLLNVLRAEIAACLRDDADLTTALGCTAADITRWRSPGRFAMLARQWPTDHPMATRMEAWRKRDKHLWEFECHERDQIIARRRDAYRKLAAWLTEAAKFIQIKDINVADAKRKPSVANEDEYQRRGGRQQIQFAAPGEFRAAIEQAAKARGVEVNYYKMEIESA